jgi:hypothetical protein
MPKQVERTSGTGYTQNNHRHALGLRRRPLGFKGQLEMADHLCPTFGREMIFSFNDRRMRRTNIRFEFIMRKPSL